MGDETQDAPGGAVWRRILWFVALWGCGVVTIAIVGYLLRALFF